MDSTVLTVWYGEYSMARDFTRSYNGCLTPTPTVALTLLVVVVVVVVLVVVLVVLVVVVYNLRLQYNE